MTMMKCLRKVNKPFHYNVGGVECIDAIMAATNKTKRDIYKAT